MSVSGRRWLRSHYTQLESTPWLPFDMPKRSVLVAALPKVYAHYFVPFPVSINNAAVIDDPMTFMASGDYYQKYWVPPGSIEVGTDHTAYGGYVRDRKKDIGVRPALSGWQVRDREQDVRWARSIGLDGFLVDILSATIGGQRWSQFLEVKQAVANVGDSTFKLGLMPDGTASATADATILADALSTVANDPAVLRRENGNLLVLPYMPEKAPSGDGSGGAAAVAFWTAFRDRMLNIYGVTTDMWFCYTNSWTATTQAPSFDPIAYGHARWGERNPAASGGTGTGARGAPAYCHTTFNKPWMHYAAPQDFRPGSAKYWDAWGSENFRASWLAAIEGGADWVQIPTWDDFSENSHIAPTLANGWSWADLTSFYLVRFKLGYWPTIVRDGLYIFHRKQPLTGCVYTGSQTQFAVLQGGDSHDDIEVLAFLTAPATVQILVDGSVVATQNVTQSHIDVGHGVVSIKGPQPSAGTVSAKILRASVTIVDFTSPTIVSSTQISEDMAYKGSSSLRLSYP